MAILFLHFVHKLLKAMGPDAESWFCLTNINIRIVRAAFVLWKIHREKSEGLRPARLRIRTG